MNMIQLRVAGNAQ